LPNEAAAAQGRAHGMTQILREENINKKKRKTTYKKMERNISVLVFALLLPNFEPLCVSID